MRLRRARRAPTRSNSRRCRLASMCGWHLIPPSSLCGKAERGQLLPALVQRLLDLRPEPLIALPGATRRLAIPMATALKVTKRGAP